MPEVAAFVAPWRATSYASTAGARSGERRFPPHITLLAPFGGQGDPAALRTLRQVAARHEPFELRFTRVEQFPGGAVWLVPEPVERVAALMLDVRAAFADLFADLPPDRSTSDEPPSTDPAMGLAPVPHLTVTVDAEPGTQARVQAALDAEGPLIAPVSTVGVWRRDGQQVWRLRHRAPLGRLPERP